MKDPRNAETLCHYCAAPRVDGATTDALQDAVAGWLAEYRALLRFGNDLPDLAMAEGLLALIARTARALPRPDENPPF